MYYVPKPVRIKYQYALSSKIWFENLWVLCILCVISMQENTILFFKFIYLFLFIYFIFWGRGGKYTLGIVSPGPQVEGPIEHICIRYVPICPKYRHGCIEKITDKNFWHHLLYSKANCCFHGEGSSKSHCAKELVKTRKT